MPLSGRARTTFVSAAVIASVMAALAGRDAAVALAPKSAVLFNAIGLPVNLDGLEIGPVRATVMDDGTRRFLVVETSISNPRDRKTAIPPLRLSVRGADGSALYTWTVTLPEKTLDVEGRLPVRTRLASPPAGSDVAVEFAPAPAGTSQAKPSAAAKPRVNG